MKLLVIGYGNELRGDDGIGPQVARAVESWNLPDVTALATHGLTPELAESISLADAVVFVDARVYSMGVEVAELRASAASRIGHTSEPGWLLALAESLWGRRPQAWLITAPGVNFAMGQPLSPQAEQGVASALLEVRTLVERIADRVVC
jgi:hydrogenase maturation protease